MKRRQEGGAGHTALGEGRIPSHHVALHGLKFKNPWVLFQIPDFEARD